MKIAIGVNRPLQNRFNTSNKRVKSYLKHVRMQLDDIGLKVATIDLLTSPHRSIKQAYLELHRESLPKFLNEQLILDGFEFDFSFIDRHINPKSSEITTASREFGVNDNGLIEPDFNFYITNENQFNLYNQLKPLCDSLNSFYEENKGNFSVFLGMVPQSLNYYLESDISNLPLLKINEYRLLHYKPK